MADDTAPKKTAAEKEADTRDEEFLSHFPNPTTERMLAEAIVELRRKVK